MGLSPGPNILKSRKIKQVAIKPSSLLELLKGCPGVPGDMKIQYMAPVMMVVESEEFDEVPHGEKIPLLEVSMEPIEQISLQGLSEFLNGNK